MMALPIFVSSSFDPAAVLKIFEVLYKISFLTVKNFFILNRVLVCISSCSLSVVKVCFEEKIKNIPNYPARHSCNIQTIIERNGSFPAGRNLAADPVISAWILCMCCFPGLFLCRQDHRRSMCGRSCLQTGIPPWRAAFCNRCG